MESLRILIAIGDDGGIILAEEVVNEYLAAFPVKQHAGALHLLQDPLTGNPGRHGPVRAYRTP